MMRTITQFKGPRYECFSNFYPAKVELDGEEYSSVEHAFHAAKTDNPRQRKAIRLAASPGRAKTMGRRLVLAPDWHEKRVVVMRLLVLSKFTLNEDLSEPATTRLDMRKMLLDTGGAVLIEGNRWHDNFWGICACGGTKETCPTVPAGENHLGQILMSVREELQW
jgi:ribA/ribD-fused uncharacterized protein